MSTSSSRVTQVDLGRNVYYRVESGLEHGALINFMLNARVRKIKAQHGPLAIKVGGKKIEHTFDFLIGFEGDDEDIDMLVAVRPRGSSLKDLETTLKQFRNQLASLGAHCIVLLTDEQISKAVVKRASDLLRSRETKNTGHMEDVLRHLVAAGRSVHVYELFDLPGLVPSEIWSAVMALMDEELVDHDHARSEEVDFSYLSMIRARKED